MIDLRQGSDQIYLFKEKTFLQGDAWLAQILLQLIA